MSAAYVMTQINLRVPMVPSGRQPRVITQRPHKAGVPVRVVQRQSFRNDFDLAMASDNARTAWEAGFDEVEEHWEHAMYEPDEDHPSKNIPNYHSCSEEEFEKKMSFMSLDMEPGFPADSFDDGSLAVQRASSQPVVAPWVPPGRVYRLDGFDQALVSDNSRTAELLYGDDEVEEHWEHAVYKHDEDHPSKNIPNYHTYSEEEFEKTTAFISLDDASLAEQRASSKPVVAPWVPPPRPPERVYRLDRFDQALVSDNSRTAELLYGDDDEEPDHQPRSGRPVHKAPVILPLIKKGVVQPTATIKAVVQSTDAFDTDVSSSRARMSDWASSVDDDEEPDRHTVGSSWKSPIMPARSYRLDRFDLAMASDNARTPDMMSYGDAEDDDEEPDRPAFKSVEATQPDMANSWKPDVRSYRLDKFDLAMASDSARNRELATYSDPDEQAKSSAPEFSSTRTFNQRDPFQEGFDLDMASDNARTRAESA